MHLCRYSELVWEAGLIGRELSRNAAKASFVNALNPGDALAGISEFGEILLRLAHSLTPMTREERVGAPPPPPKASKKSGFGKSGKGGKGRKDASPPKGNLGSDAPPSLPPPLLVPGGEGMIFEASAEAALLSKLELVLTKLVAIAGDDAEDPIVLQMRSLYPIERPRVRGTLGSPQPFPGPPPPTLGLSAEPPLLPQAFDAAAFDASLLDAGPADAETASEEAAALGGGFGGAAAGRATRAAAAESYDA